MKRTINKDKLLVLEPFVFYKFIDNIIHLYNSKTGFSIIRKSKKLANFLKKNKNNYYNYFYLNTLEIEQDIELFIETIQNSFFGFVISLKNNFSEPIQITPSNLIGDLLVNAKKQSNFEYSIKNLNEIHLFDKQENLEQYYFFESNKVKFLINENINSKFDFNKFFDFIKPALGFGNINRINLYANSNFDNNIVDIVDFIRKENNMILINLNFVFNKIINIDYLKDFAHHNKNNNFTITVILKSSLNKKKFFKLFEFFKDYRLIKKLIIQCIIENNDDLRFFENLHSELPSQIFRYKPFFNGKNYNFFEENIFLSYQDILELKPDSLSIIKNQYINYLNFGKLFILSNGDIFSNLYQPRIGNYYRDDINFIIEKELTKGKNWLKVRKLVEPCRSCIYEILCPPISNYEYALNKFQICNFKKNTIHE